jgi:RimJ/RimL family protein N-acetyltransferase
MTEIIKNSTVIIEKDIWTDEIILVGEKLRLEPLSLAHLDDLAKNLPSPNNWHTVHWNFNTKSDIQDSIEKCIQARANRVANSFAFIVKATGEAVGMSQTKAFSRRDKYLMMSYAFEILECIRVEFRVDSLNLNSQRAVKRLGAKFEGELRNTRILSDGRKRDYHIYAVIDSEWNNIKGHLKYVKNRYV